MRKAAATCFAATRRREGATPADAAFTLSKLGEHYLAGLLEHARAMAVFCTPTVNGFARFRPNALAPQSVLWGRDNRGAMLRVIGDCGDAATRIENRIGEPAANPYLYLASQIHAGLDGMERQLKAPPATDAPYASAAEKLPTSLGEALEALRADAAFVAAFGDPFVDYFTHVKQSELMRWEQARRQGRFPAARILQPVLMITIHFIPAPGAGDPIQVRCKTGQSLMLAAVAANVQGIEAECGGLMTCGTCHVYVREPHAARLPPPGDDEQGMLEFTASPRRAHSRLACQIELTEALDGLTVDLPESQY